MSPTATNMTSELFEQRIRELTQAVNGQYPRPWMTSLTDPLHARVFIVGMNQRKGYDVERVGAHVNHLDALFNRNWRTCRGMYDEITERRPSPTRANVDGLTSLLRGVGVTDMLETNVVCYSTPMSHSLSQPPHRQGARKGSEIFRFVWEAIVPPVAIAHGERTRRKLMKLFGAALPPVPTHPSAVSEGKVATGTRQSLVIVIPCLAPPEYQKWAKWAPEHLERVVERVRHCLP